MRAKSSGLALDLCKGAAGRRRRYGVTAERRRTTQWRASPLRVCPLLRQRRDQGNRNACIGFSLASQTVCKPKVPNVRSNSTAFRFRTAAVLSDRKSREKLSPCGKCVSMVSTKSSSIETVHTRWDLSPLSPSGVNSVFEIQSPGTSLTPATATPPRSASKSCYSSGSVRTRRNS